MESFLAPTYFVLPVELCRGAGSLLYDKAGREYIDFTSGIGVCALGYGDPGWNRAVAAQLEKASHICNLYCAPSREALARRLCEKTGMKKVFFSNSGAEANECAVKIARKYSAQRKGKECCHILTLTGSFHGRTLSMLAATGQDQFHTQFQPLTPGFCYTPRNGIRQLRHCIENLPIAGILLECIQGESGVRVLDREFVRETSRLARQADIPLIVDEVQTGNGRTGRLYSYLHYDITPDIVTTAKGLAGGLPLGATLLGEKVEGVLQPGDHGSTFGGNPVSCAGGLYVLEQLTEEFLSRVMEKGNSLRNAFSGAPGIEAVTGMGLMLGIQTKRPAKEIQQECLTQGLLVLTAKDRLRLLPPLNIPDGLLQTGANILKKACQ